MEGMQEENKVVLIDFWTYTCINCIRTLPYVRVWNEKYADHGLVILGVHTPEFKFEEEYDNVVVAVGKFDSESIRLCRTMTSVRGERSTTATGPPSI